MMSHPKVAVELSSRQLCGAVDFSDPEQYCARFETPEAIALRKLDAQKCPTQVSTVPRFAGDFSNSKGADWPASEAQQPWTWR